MGAEIAFNFQCPFCSNKIRNFIASLDDVDVDCKVKNYPDTVSYKLRKPIDLDGKQIEEIAVCIAKWDAMEKARDQKSNDEATMKEHTFRNSIVGVTGISGYVDSDLIIAKLKKIDIEYLHKTISKHNAGPEVAAEVKCDKCRGEFFRAIDWGYDHFFGIGSLPET
jgi:hypothetical protein